MRWVMIAVLCAGLSGALAAAEEAASARAGDAAAESLKPTEFHPLRDNGTLVHLEREILGVVVQDVMLAQRRTRDNVTQYRLTIRLRNAGKEPQSSDLRLVLWSEGKPAAAFDIRTQDRGTLLPPRTLMRFVSEFGLPKGTVIDHFSVVPLPPRLVPTSTEQPVPVAPSAALPSTPSASGDGQPLTAEQREQLARYQAEMARLYAQQMALPNQTAPGQLQGIGPYGPQYLAPGGGGVFMVTPNGAVLLQQPQRIAPLNMRPFPLP